MADHGGRTTESKGSPMTGKHPGQALRTLLLALCALSSACASSALTPQRQQAAIRSESSLKQLIERGEASAAIGDMTRAEQYFVAALKAGGNERGLVQRLLVVCVADQRYPVAA